MARPGQHERSRVRGMAAKPLGDPTHRLVAAAQLCWTQSLPPGQGRNGLTGQHVARPGGSGIILLRLSTVLLFLGVCTAYVLLDEGLKTNLIKITELM